MKTEPFQQSSLVGTCVHSAHNFECLEVVNASEYTYHLSTKCTQDVIIIQSLLSETILIFEKACMVEFLCYK